MSTLRFIETRIVADRGCGVWCLLHFLRSFHKYHPKAFVMARLEYFNSLK